MTIHTKRLAPSTPKKLLLILVFKAYIAVTHPLLLHYQTSASCDSGNASSSFQSQPWCLFLQVSFFLISQYFLCFLTLLSFWYPYYMYIGMLNIFLWECSFFLIIFTCVLRLHNLCRSTSYLIFLPLQIYCRASLMKFSFQVLCLSKSEFPFDSFFKVIISTYSLFEYYT